LDLLSQAASAPYLSEQSDKLRLVEEVKRAAARERSGEAIFEKRPDLAAAAYYLLAKSRHGKSEAGHRTMGTLKAAIHGAMSPGVNGESSVQSALSLDFRLRGIIHENPAAFYGLVYYLGQTSFSYTGEQLPCFAVESFTELNSHKRLLGPYRFRTIEILSIFDLLQPNGFVYKPVRSYFSDPETSRRLDALVSQETPGGPKIPNGVPLETGLRILFGPPPGGEYDVALGRRPADPLDAIVTAIRYRRVEDNGALLPRRPGSGIGHFMALNASLKAVTESLARDYRHFSKTGLEILPFEHSLFDYLKTVIGRQLSREETWGYLQKGREGFPVRDAVIEALGVRPEEFDQVIERAAKAGAFGESLRNDASRTRRRLEISRVK
jgi:hypothetical protein